jgi:hypothetical protein
MWLMYDIIDYLPRTPRNATTTTAKSWTAALLRPLLRRWALLRR